MVVLADQHRWRAVELLATDVRPLAGGATCWKAGLDLATGEPDPYADMFPR